MLRISVQITRAWIVSVRPLRLEFKGDHKGVRGVEANVKRTHAPLPNLKLSIRDMFGEGNRVVSRLTLRSVHAGKSGKGKEMHEIIIHKVVRNKIAESWAIGSRWT